MIERLMGDQTLTLGERVYSCSECGRPTMFEWYSISLCSLDCLEDLAAGWGAEMMCGPEEMTDYERRITEAPPVPEWWPWYYL